MTEKKRFYVLHSKHKGSLYTSFFVFFIDIFGWAIVFPLFAPIILDARYGILATSVSTDVRNIALAILFAAYPLAQFFGAPFFGEVSDRKGRKKAFLFSLIGVTLGYFLSATTMVYKSYFGLLIARFITGFFAGSLNISLATIADMSTAAKDRTKNFNLIAILGGLAWVVATLAGGDLSDRHLERYFGPAIPFWLAGGMTILSLLAVIFAFRETCSTVDKSPFHILQGLRDIKIAFSLPKIRSLFLAYLFWAVAWVMILGWFAALSIERFSFHQTTIALVLLGNGVVWMLTNLLAYHVLTKRFSLKKLVVISYLASSLCIGITCFSDQISYVIFFLLAIAFSALLWSTTLSLISLHAPPELQGVTLGVGQAVFSFGIILGLLIAGPLADMQISLPYLFSAVILFIGFIIIATKSYKIPIPGE